METKTIIITAIQIIIATGIFNVWLLRFGKASSWRGGSANNMTEEFKAYGLSAWSVMAVGAFKISFATLLIIGIWIPVLAQVSAIGIAVFMLGAIIMHLKIKDPLKKSLPAFSLFVLALLVLFV